MQAFLGFLVLQTMLLTTFEKFQLENFLWDDLFHKTLHQKMCVKYQNPTIDTLGHSELPHSIQGKIPCVSSVLTFSLCFGSTIPEIYYL